MSWNVTNNISAIKSAKPMPLMTFRYLDGISFLKSATATVSYTHLTLPTIHRV